MYINSNETFYFFRTVYFLSLSEDLLWVCKKCVLRCYLSCMIYESYYGSLFIIEYSGALAFEYVEVEMNFLLIDVSV